ncbi:MAG: hypothetical protein E7Z99_05935 [Coriobacteriaceae bacterium]|jgi:hypothetical protein|nr:hypothetical protein [Coriobacteriaceae bacterium]
MNKEELLALDNSEIAKMLNDAIAAGKSKDEALAELELTQADLTKQNIFWVKDKFLARAWSGYTSTKRSGNEYAQEGDGWRGDDVKDFKGREVPW